MICFRNLIYPGEEIERTNEEIIEVVLFRRRKNGAVEGGVGAEEVMGLGELSVDEGEVVDGGGDAEAPDMR